MSNRNARQREILGLIGRHIDVRGFLKANPSFSRDEVETALACVGIAAGREAPSGPLAVVLYTDGAASGNPGPAGIGVVIADESGHVISELSEYIGRATCNVAEYTALVVGLEEAVRLGARRVTVCADSELLVRQLNGAYQVKSPSILRLYEQATKGLEALEEWKAVHVPREKNQRADSLARKAIAVSQET